MQYHLAQINIARLLAPLDDPKIADFVSQLDSINALAERAGGFVWRLQSAASGNATDLNYNGDPFVIVNMSVWDSVESLRDYVYASQHIEVFRDRSRWFEKADKPHYCLWWVPVGHLPPIAEGRERLEHYQLHGATQFSFWFSQRFPAPADREVFA